MYDNGQFMTPQQIIAMAEAEKISPLLYAIRHAGGYKNSMSFWGRPSSGEVEIEKYPVVTLGNSKDIVGKYSANVADAVKFPRSTAYMHFLGCVASAMMGRFTVEYFDDQDQISLYIVTSQPPSTGKSAINKAAIGPIVYEVDAANEERKRERAKVRSKLDAIKDELKGDLAPQAKADLLEERAQLLDQDKKLANIIFPISDPTPEGLAKINNNQGNFAVISDESTGVNTLLGMSYGDSSRKANNELVLKGWDYGHVAVARSNEENNLSFKALGCIAIIAQDESIDSILNAGSRGTGVSERFLIMRERNMLGDRDFSKRTRIDKGLKAEYFQLIHNIMTEQHVDLEVTDEAFHYLSDCRQELEPHLKDGGKYGHTMLRGVMGKFDRQVTRIAAVLHTIREWEKGGAKRRKITKRTMEEAVLIYNELAKTYISSADAAGFAGDNSELSAVSEYITGRATMGKGMVQYRALYQAMRKKPVFSGHSSMSVAIKDRVLPKLEAQNVICVDGETIYINPKLRG